MVIVGGKVMLENKLPTRVNKEEILREAQNETNKMIKRMDAKPLLELPDGFWGKTKYL